MSISYAGHLGSGDLDSVDWVVLTDDLRADDFDNGVS